jgi:hypothetical protein
MHSLRHLHVAEIVAASTDSNCAPNIGDSVKPIAPMR